MNLKSVKFVLVSALILSAAFATVLTSAVLHANETPVIKCSGDPVDGGHPTFSYVGDPVDGGHPNGNQTGNQTG